MGFFRRVLEALFINFIWWIVQPVLVSITFVIAAIKPDLLKNWPADLIYIIVLVLELFFLLILFFRQHYYPSFKWNIIHGNNSYTLTYITREEALCEKKIEVIPMRNKIESFPDGEYRWSGSSSEPYIVEADDFDFTHIEINGRTEYTIHPKEIVKAYKHIDYTINIKLRDENHTAIPTNFIYVKRPAKRITLILRMAAGIKIHNVWCRAKTKYGEENRFISKKGINSKENGYNIYTFTIRRPKLFCEYEIDWDWV